MKYSRSLLGVLCLFVLGACAGVSSTEAPRVTAEEGFALRDCSPHVRRVRGYDDPPAVVFIQHISLVFSCEYYLGDPLEFYGQRLQVNGRDLRAGYGFAVSDRDRALNELLQTANLEGYYSMLHKGVTARVIQRGELRDGEFVYRHRTYLVEVGNRYVGFRAVVALSAFPFYEKGQPYTVFLWVHGINLPDRDILRAFTKIMTVVPHPEIESASK